VVDSTAGGGGHAEALLHELGPAGRLIVLDADAHALARVRDRLGDDTRIAYVCGNFRNLAANLETLGVERVDRILLDLGLSSDQLDQPTGRGFSFQRDEPLRMTFAAEMPEGALTAWHVVNEWSEESLADILFGFGGERRARKLARAIVEARAERPLETSAQLAALTERTLGTRGAIHPATRTFQAIRMAVNDELGALEAALAASTTLLAPGGRIAVIAFHSLEDRIVKRTFRSWQDQGLGQALTKRPIVPSRRESLANRRARSAKLRGFEMNQ